jgi:ribonuclease HI
VGWAWILVDEHPVASGSGKTPAPSNHQRCELTAAIEGLTYLVASGVREVELLSDSRYVVGGMSSTGCTGCTGWARAAAEREWHLTRGKPVKNRDLWERLLELEGYLSVTWRHVRGHGPKKDTSDDARYNREVDARAGDARQGLVALES